MMSEDLPGEQPPANQVFCPHCGAAQDAAPCDRPQLLQCAVCAQCFILPAADGSTPPVARTGASNDGFVVIDDSAPDDGTSDEDELDGLRIRQLAQARRAAYRSRSYCFIGSAVSAAAAGQLIYKAVMNVHLSGWTAAPILYLAVVPPALFLAWRLLCRARRFGREARQSLLGEPATPPDFSSLSDGSHIWKRLEK